MADWKLIVIASDIDVIGTHEEVLIELMRDRRDYGVVCLGGLRDGVDHEKVLEWLRKSLPKYKFSLEDFELASEFEFGYDAKKSFSHSIKPRDSRYVGNNNGRQNYSKGKK